MTDIQNIIKNAYSEAQEKEQEPSEPDKEVKKKFKFKSGEEELLEVQQNFHSNFSTIVWFIEQDPFLNVAMNLDVNFRKVKYTNFVSPRKVFSTR